MATNEAAIDVTGVAGSIHGFSIPQSLGGRASSRAVTGEKPTQIAEQTPTIQTKKRQFSMAAAAKPANVDPKDTAEHDATNKSGQPPRHIPKLSKMNIKIQTGAVNAQPTSSRAQNTLSKMEGCNLVMAIACDIHQLTEEGDKLTSWGTSKFGILTRVTTARTEVKCENKCVVQLVWAVGDLSAEAPQVTRHLIKPEGFEICTRAHQKHRISHTQAMHDDGRRPG